MFFFFWRYNMWVLCIKMSKKGLLLCYTFCWVVYLHYSKYFQQRSKPERSTGLRKLMPQSRHIDPHQPWWLYLPHITHTRLTTGSFVFTRKMFWFTHSSHIDLLCISRELASKDTQTVCSCGVCIQVSHWTQHSPETPVLALLFPPLLSAMLHSWSKSNFSPPAPAQKSTLQYTNAWQWRTPPRITAAVRLINRSEDKSTVFFCLSQRF